jgi:large subunit ribosomal protein L29
MADVLDIQNIREMSDDEILDKLDEAREEMHHLRLQKVTGELKDTNLFKKARRNLARLKTVMTERRLAEEMSKKETNNGE